MSRASAARSQRVRIRDTAPYQVSHFAHSELVARFETERSEHPVGRFPPGISAVPVLTLNAALWLRKAEASIVQQSRASGRLTRD
jgi:hypothetical protein